MSAEMEKRILAAIARASGQRPARAADLAAQLGGDEPAFRAALEQLAGERRINTAHIQKQGDAAPWLAIWPTGLIPRSAAWSRDSHGGLFVKHAPDDLFRAYAPRTAPAAPTQTGPRPAPAPKPAPVKEPDMEPRDFEPRKKGQLQGELAPQPLYRAGDIRVVEIGDEPVTAHIEFALWDDGRLTIAEGDEITLLPPEATKRLALLLGVPGSELPQRPSRMPPLPHLADTPAPAISHR